MKEAKKPKPIIVGSGNPLSQLFFFWVFRFIILLRKTKDIKDLLLVLRPTEQADYNDKILEIKWAEEKERALKAKKKPMIRTALFKAFGLNFILNGN
jgi:hypothetical protein